MGGLDQYIIDRLFSPVTGWIHHKLGVDQWRLALECLNGTVAFHLAGVAISLTRQGLSDTIFADLLAVVAWLCIMGLIRRAACRQAASSLGRQTARMREALFRVILIAMLPLSVYYIRGLDNLCHTASLVLFIAHLYFKACDAPPPQARGKLAWQGR